MHQVCVSLGLFHFSQGQEKERQVVVCRKEEVMKEVGKSASSTVSSLPMYDPSVSKVCVSRKFSFPSDASKFMNDKVKRRVREIQETTKTEDLAKNMAHLSHVEMGDVSWMGYPSMETTTLGMKLR